MKKITIVIPVYNGALTLERTLNSIFVQKHKELVEQLIIINDGSSDISQDIINNFNQNEALKTTIIHHKKSKGLAASYNEGLTRTSTEYVLTIHQDIVIEDDNAFTKIIEPFNLDAAVVATFPVLMHSKSLWDTYNFWQKCLFDRHVRRLEHDLTGKFDCFKTNILKEVNGFDEKHFRTAGEDADLKHKFKLRALKIVSSGVVVEHAQDNNSKYSLRNLTKKEAQLAEARGVILRRYGMGSLKEFALNFFREIILLMLLIPFIQIFGFILVLAYSYTYTKLVFSSRPKDRKLFVLPFVNIYLLFVNTVYSGIGFVRGRQFI